MLAFELECSYNLAANKMLQPQDKAAFLGYLDSLLTSGAIVNSTRRNYGTWANRLDTYIPENLTSLNSFSEEEIERLAETLPPQFNQYHKEDARSMLRHYRRHRERQFLCDVQTKIAPPNTEEEERKRVLGSIAVRRGQKAFRDTLIHVFGSRCAVTKTDDDATLEAAHIRPYSRRGASSSVNGLLLRADIHVLFDLHLISVHPKKFTVFCHGSIRSSKTYGGFHGTKSLLASLPAHVVDRTALAEHYQETKG